jgi:enterochelin esterase family protein
MNKFLPFMVLLFASSSIQAQTFQAFIDRVNSAPQAQREAIVDSFVTAAPAFPYTEQDTLVHYIYRGSASRVNVPSDANSWDANAFPMIRLSTTTLWYHTRTFEADARLDYKFVLNGSTWILDPRNPHQVSGGFGPNSELRMPAYAPPLEVLYYPNIPHGALRDTSFFSASLGNARTIRVYTPPDYTSSSERYPVILFHDGLEFITLAQANNVIDYLISQKRIKPVIAVFVPPVNRREEYATSLQNQFTTFIVTEVMPWVDRRYRTLTDPASRAALGASDGGNISLWLGYKHPEVFGNVAALSSNVESNVSSGFQSSPTLNLKFYLDMGTYDISVLITRMNSFLPILQAKGYTFQYLEFHDGHSWGNWRSHIDNALEIFFPNVTVSVDEKETSSPGAYQLRQNYPNPFSVGRSSGNSATTIRYDLSQREAVRISVYNVAGQLVATLVDQRQGVGAYSAVWDGRNAEGALQAGGVYFYRLQIGGRIVETRKMVLLR